MTDKLPPTTAGPTSGPTKPGDTTKPTNPWDTTKPTNPTDPWHPTNPTPTADNGLPTTASPGAGGLGAGGVAGLVIGILVVVGLAAVLLVMLRSRDWEVRRMLPASMQTSSGAGQVFQNMSYNTGTYLPAASPPPAIPGTDKTTANP